MADNVKRYHPAAHRRWVLASRAFLLVIMFTVAISLAWPLQTRNAPAAGDYEVVQIHPHDFRAFTQGLLIADGELYESTGRRGASTLRRVHLETGIVLQERKLADEHFGEGLALVDDRLVQLTWQSGKGFVYDRETFELLEEFDYPGEGWGLTYDGTELIMSDGTAELRFLDPITFTEKRRVSVTDRNGPVTMLNELEYVDGEVWANVWQTDLIARIAPETGTLVGYVDLSDLIDNWAWNRFWLLRTDVLNGIAYDERNEQFYLTGKLWPATFTVRIPRVEDEA